MAGETADDAFTHAYPSLFLPALRVAYRIAGDAHVAEDLAAEAMARCYARWRSVRDLPHREAWVLRVVTNLAVDTLRRRRPAQHAQERARVELSRQAASDSFTDAMAIRLELADALRRLPGRQRDTVMLRYLAGMNDIDISTLLGISASSVRTHAQRGLAALRDALGAGLGTVIVDPD